MLVPRATHLTLEAIENLAESVGKKIGLCPHGNIESLIRELGGSVHRSMNFPYLLIVHRPKNFEVYIDQYEGRGAYLIKMAMAIAYYSLHYRVAESEVMLVPEKNLCVVCYREASNFAAALLVPREPLIEQMRLQRQIITDVARFFDVDGRVIQHRLNSIRFYT